MTAPQREKLYSPELLSLATALADYPYDPNSPLLGEARSRTCGSSVACALALDGEERVEAIGLKVAACAVGQAAAAVFASSVIGRTSAEIGEAEDAIARWLDGAPEEPDWPGMTALRPALHFPGRHAAILLPWKAAEDALSKVDMGG